MSGFFAGRDVQRDPTDIELVREVTLQELSDWLIFRVIGGFHAMPEDLVRRLKRLEDLDALKSDLLQVFKEMRDGDAIWLAQSRFRDTLIGHEGIALVRDNRPIAYIRVLNH